MIALPQKSPGFVVEQVTGRLVAVVGKSGERAFVVWDGRVKEDGAPLLRTVWSKKTFPLVDVMPKWWFKAEGEPRFYHQPHAPNEPILCWPTNMGPLWAWQGDFDDVEAAPVLHLVSRTSLRPSAEPLEVEARQVG